MKIIRSPPFNEAERGAGQTQLEAKETKPTSSEGSLALPSPPLPHREKLIPFPQPSTCKLRPSPLYCLNGAPLTAALAGPQLA